MCVSYCMWWCTGGTGGGVLGWSQLTLLIKDKNFDLLLSSVVAIFLLLLGTVPVSQKTHIAILVSRIFEYLS